MKCYTEVDDETQSTPFMQISIKSRQKIQSNVSSASLVRQFLSNI